MSGVITVVDGFDVVVQDLGRSGVERLSLNRGGASDTFSFRAANILVGNQENTPALELTGSGMTIEARQEVVAAVTGAECLLLVDGEIAVPSWSPIRIPAGSRLEVSAPVRGFRIYLAFRGGVQADRMYGSVAPVIPGHDTGTVLSSGAEIELGAAAGAGSVPEAVPAQLRRQASELVLPPDRTLEVLAGIDEHMFEGIERLYAEEYTVNPRSNAVGTRLNGASPVRTDYTEILSRSLPYGGIEIPSEGEVIVLLRSRFMTAGYPVPGVVSSASLDRAGQLAPGETARFRRSDEQTARRALFARESVLDRLRAFSFPPSAAAQQPQEVA